MEGSTDVGVCMYMMGCGGVCVWVCGGVGDRGALVRKITVTG